MAMEQDVQNQVEEGDDGSRPDRPCPQGEQVSPAARRSWRLTPCTAGCTTWTMRITAVPNYDS